MSRVITLFAATLLCACGGALADAEGSDALCSAPLVNAAVGATLTSSGASFRLWAPGADGGTVQGDWSSNPKSLKRECSSDYLSNSTSGPKVGQSFLYTVVQSGVPAQVIDPRAREVSSGKAVLTDPSAYVWQSAKTNVPALAHAVIYELHVGSFDPTGTFAGVASHLDYLKDLGVNAIELMPLAQFQRAEDWGYGPQAPWAIESPDQ